MPECAEHPLPAVPQALFNGDLLLAAHAPAGQMFVLLGDFTGHGLPAAIGAMPLAETFYGMAAKGYSSTDILREINAKLKQILPVEMFCCATLLDIDAKQGTLRVERRAAGWLPDFGRWPAYRAGFPASPAGRGVRDGAR